MFKLKVRQSTSPLAREIKVRTYLLRQKEYMKRQMLGQKVSYWP